MKRNAKLAWVCHYNFDHSEVNRKESLDIIDTGLEKIIKIQSKIPWNFNAPTESLKFIEYENPELIKKLGSNPMVQIIPCLRTHALPTLFSSYWFKRNFERGYEDINTLFNKSKISKVGCMPEMDFSMKYVDETKKIWDIVIVDSDDTARKYPYREDFMNRSYRSIKSGDSNKKNLISIIGNTDQDIPAIVINNGEGNCIRNNYLKYFRGIATADKLIESIQMELDKATERGEPVVTSLTDIEVPYVNSVNGKPILDALEELFYDLRSSGIKFTKLDKPICKAIIKYLGKSNHYTIATDRFKEKWYSDSRAQAMLSNINDALNPNQENLSLHAQGSDPFSMLFFDRKGGMRFKRMYKGKKINDLFISSDPLRKYELEHTLGALRGEYKLEEKIHKSLPEVQRYFTVLNNIYQNKNK